jgi:hypothetical protein
MVAAELWCAPRVVVAALHCTAGYVSLLLVALMRPKFMHCIMSYVTLFVLFFTFGR